MNTPILVLACILLGGPKEACEQPILYGGQGVDWSRLINRTGDCQEPVCATTAEGVPWTLVDGTAYRREAPCTWRATEELLTIDGGIHVTPDDCVFVWGWWDSEGPYLDDTSSRQAAALDDGGVGWNSVDLPDETDCSDCTVLRSVFFSSCMRGHAQLGRWHGRRVGGPESGWEILAQGTEKKAYYQTLDRGKTWTPVHRDSIDTSVRAGLEAQRPDR